MESVFTIKGVFKEAYAIIKPKFWTVIGQFALIVIGYAILSGVFRHIQLLRLITMFIYIFVTIVFSLSYAEKGSFSFDDVTHALTLKRFCYFFLATILYGLSVIGGAILIIIPGIMFAVMMHFYKFSSVEKDISPIKAIKESIRITKGYRWKIFWFSLLSGLIAIAGFLCLFIGILFALPLIMIADALIYKKLSHTVKHEKTEEVVEEVVVVEAVAI